MQARTHRHFGALTLALMGATMPAFADTFETIDLPLGALNTNVLGWSDGATYAPLFAAGHGTAAGTVPFLFATNAAGNNVLYAYDAVDVAVGLSGVTTVYTLMNTAFGIPGTRVGSLAFAFDSGESFSVDLVEGVNIRDHFQGEWANTVSDPSVTTNVFGSPEPARAHIDMQAIAIPVAYQSLTLSKVTFSSTHAGNGGTPFLAALTVSVVPEPATSAMVVAGLLAAGLGAIRRRTAAPSALTTI